jgi:hypothetical protein
MECVPSFLQMRKSRHFRTIQILHFGTLGAPGVEFDAAFTVVMYGVFMVVWSVLQADIVKLCLTLGSAVVVTSIFSTHRAIHGSQTLAHSSLHSCYLLNGSHDIFLTSFCFIFQFLISFLSLEWNLYDFYLIATSYASATALSDTSASNILASCLISATSWGGSIVTLSGLYIWCSLLSILVRNPGTT